jgi:hypothetical protein
MIFWCLPMQTSTAMTRRHLHKLNLQLGLFITYHFVPNTTILMKFWSDRVITHLSVTSYQNQSRWRTGHKSSAASFWRHELTFLKHTRSVHDQFLIAWGLQRACLVSTVCLHLPGISNYTTNTQDEATKWWTLQCQRRNHMQCSFLCRYTWWTAMQSVH